MESVNEESPCDDGEFYSPLSASVTDIGAEEIQQMEQEIQSLFNNKSYYSILKISKGRVFEALTPETHVIVCLTLFKLGRVDSSLRNFSFIIGNEPNPLKRKYLLDNLIQLLKKLGYNNKAIGCIEELQSLEELDLKISNSTEIEQRIEKYREEIGKLSSRTFKGEQKTITLPHSPIHEQVIEFLKTNADDLTELSFGKLCLAQREHLLLAKSLLQSWSQGVEFSEDPVDLVYQSIKVFVPHYLYNELFEDSTILIDYIDDAIFQFPEIDNSVNARKYVRLLALWNNHQETISSHLIVMTELMIKLHLIRGFISQQKEEYEPALVHYRWLLSFFSVLEDEFDQMLGTSPYISKVVKRTVQLLMYECYNFGAIQASKKDLTAMFSNLVTDNSVDLNRELVEGRLHQFFLACGFYYEKLSYHEKYLVSVDHFQNDIKKTQFAYRLEPNHIGEMIRKYIIAAVSMPLDNPSNIAVYDRILWGLLAYGGIHYKTLWFFICVRHFIYLQNDFGPIYLDKVDKYRLFRNDDILASYENGWEIIDKYHRIISKLTPDSSTNFWNTQYGTTFLLPQIYVQSSRLFIGPDFIDETLSFNSTKLFILTPIKNKLMQKNSDIRRPSSLVVKQRIGFSQDLIHLWVTTFQQYHGPIPSFVSKLLQQM